ncbi:MAG: FAD-binding oxidoreductase [Zoogloeaceae bacterium]|jgi:FAD/FMN-containing dehydrogenase|nr:FAD-binding oxidoreductase [Zoogloeaceae bacterium]
MPERFTPLSPADQTRFRARLAAVVGERALLTEAAEMAALLTDWRGRYHGRALAAVSPKTAEELSEVVKTCLAFGVPMVPQGGNTGLCGGATPDASGTALLIRLHRLKRIRALDVQNNVIITEAGVTLAAVQAAAREAGRLFPLSLAAEGSCQIGGNLSTNAGGVHVLRYGTMRDLTLGLEAVLPDGQLWSGLATLRKNNTGYDLKQLLIGAEGTLGLITAAALKLFPPPRQRVLAWLGLATPAGALALLERTQTVFSTRLAAFELICPLALTFLRRHFPGLAPQMETPWQVLCELTDSDPEDEALATRSERFWATELETGGILDAIVARSEGEIRALWAAREHLSEAQKREGVSLKHDIALPISRVPEFLARIEPELQAAFPGVRHTAFGHLGDGNLHFNLSHADPAENVRLLAQSERLNRVVYDVVHALSGSISAEHGIGQLKREMLPRYQPPAARAAMQTIKAALDPRGLMNPGKVL